MQSLNYGEILRPPSVLRDMADRYRRYAAMWRAQGRIEDADAMDTAADLFDRTADKEDRKLMDRYRPEGVERGEPLEEGGSDE